MSPRDQGRTDGLVPTEPVRCTCGDLDVLHNLSTSGERTGCSSSLCDCKRFVAAVAS
ncbi:hypothetical protein [Actinoplanes palleronii]|uniref:Uncharacterized protein n=1 Tax=Actinoplanes palleronii TaxID=113570 RepID=A0ABQ4BJC0_9ACTN|nr:hypothetical protein [Actinoplanes palleronii]GIE70769.1 hypothetical protein Apa02nite_068770 [Actinoplanes palleronii]